MQKIIGSLDVEKSSTTCDLCGKTLNKTTEAELTDSFGSTGYMCKGDCEKK